MNKKLFVFDRDYLIASPDSNTNKINFIDDKVAAIYFSQIDPSKYWGFAEAKASGLTALIYEDFIKPLVNSTPQIEARAVTLIDKFGFDFVCVAIASDEALLFEGLYQTYIVDKKLARRLTSSIKAPGVGLAEVLVIKYKLPGAMVFAAPNKYKSLFEKKIIVANPE